MSVLNHETMTNHHDAGVIGHLSETLHLWRQRYRTRAELAQWTERDLHDVGLSRGEILTETEKHFWQA